VAPINKSLLSEMKKNDKIPVFLGKNTEFEGKLALFGTIKIEGHVRGELLSEGKLLIGREGVIEANIHTSSIVISGEVRGNVTADQRIDVVPSGKVFGNIQSPVVVIHEGGLFEGNCRMCKAKEADESEGEGMAKAGLITNGVFETHHSELDRPPESTEPETIEPQQKKICKGLTAKDKPCKLHPLPGSDYCQWHQDQGEE